jgi:hypothetical protein
MREITSQALAGKYEITHPRLDFLNKLKALHGPGFA